MNHKNSKLKGNSPILDWLKRAVVLRRGWMAASVYVTGVYSVTTITVEHLKYSMEIGKKK